MHVRSRAMIAMRSRKKEKRRTLVGRGVCLRA
jgi:hypothetical protein